jgi:UPF0042 nucleotide-binding protein
MNLYIITGLSGAGKTNVLRIFEDNNFYCIDNLPANLIKNSIEEIKESKINSVAITIDSRNINIKKLPEILKELEILHINIQLIFLSASQDQIIKRFNESRRKHPLISNMESLDIAIQQDRRTLSSFSDNFIHIDTTGLSLNNLNYKINCLISSKDKFHLHFISFAFKKGVPLDVDFLFDVRELTNPFYNNKTKDLSGLDKKVEEFLMSKDSTKALLEDLSIFISNRINNLIKSSRKYLSIGIGCTGGRHRSVLMVKKISEKLKKNHKINLSIFHRDINV